MAVIHGNAGEWARVKGTVFGLWPLFVSAFALGFALAAWLFYSPVFGASLSFAALLSSVFALQHGLSRVERYFKGARGEERVSWILRSLPDTYHVFNDFVAGRKHVDHVVVGPAGVFSVETKCWRGKVTLEEGHILLDGQLPDRAPLSQALREASLVKGELAKLGWSGTVTPVLTFASDTFEAKIAEAQGVVVLNSNHLKESFSTGRVVMPPAELERLVRLMESKE